MEEYVTKMQAKNCITKNELRTMMVQELHDLPPADVRPNIHGHWESDGHGHIICSACKEANVSTWKSRFCPMCGADMREPKGEKGTE